jgi:hypothetical protein
MLTGPYGTAARPRVGGVPRHGTGRNWALNTACNGRTHAKATLRDGRRSKVRLVRRAEEPGASHYRRSEWLRHQ